MTRFTEELRSDLIRISLLKRLPKTIMVLSINMERAVYQDEDTIEFAITLDEIKELSKEILDVLRRLGLDYS